MRGTMAKTTRNGKKNHLNKTHHSKKIHGMLADKMLERDRRSGSPQLTFETERQLRDLLQAIEAVRRGDLSKRLTRERYDIFGEIADSYNGMMENLKMRW